ncbi:PREDICTED: putative gustatory receptor 2a [Bactrocera latifrons]|uniref:putative gustatory receptor 2a n=1 Tax=Bactrocera latifrons TaxID=174628 RepID=UPI0008DC5C25|nr:PREDICTED: putative gustatory receptor 2a [Bactrocera latifrons]
MVERKTGKFYLSRLLECYAICTLLIAFAILILDIFSDGDYFRMSVNDVGHRLDYIQLMGIRVAHFVSVLEAFLRRHGQNTFIKQVRELDRIFECSLNVHVDNGHLRQKILRRGVVMIFIFVSVEALKLLVYFLACGRNFPIYWLFYMLPFLICGVRYFQIFTAIMIVRHRLDKLVTVINELNLLNSKPKQYTADNSNTSIKFITQATTVYEITEYLKHQYDMENTDVKRLLIIRDLYNRLWELTATVNKNFGISILTNVGNDFISITTNCYWIFLQFNTFSASLENFLQISSNLIWSITHLFNVLMLAMLCERTVQRTTAIAMGLHRIETNIWNDNHNTVIEQFSLQLLHQKLAFSAAGFFDINCSLLYTIAGATTTYLIILIQFHMSDDN